jgi:hypothetical protein
LLKNLKREPYKGCIGKRIRRMVVVMSRRLFVLVVLLVGIAVPLRVLLAQAPSAKIAPDTAPQVQMLGTLWDAEMRLYGLQLLPNGQQLLLSQTPRGEANQIVVLDMTNQAVSALWQAEADQATLLTLSPDGQQAAFAAQAQVYSLSLPDGAVSELYHADAEFLLATALAFSPDGSRLAIGRADGSVILLNAASGQVLSRLLLPSSGAAMSEEESASPSEDVAAGALVWLSEEALIAGYADGMLRWWSLSSAQVEQEWEGHRRAISDVVLIPGTGQLASVGRDRQVRLWSLDDVDAPLQSWPAYATYLTLSPDESLLAAGAKSLFLFDLATQTQAYSNFHADEQITAAFPHFSPDGSLVFTGSRAVAAWGLASDLPLTPLEEDRIAAGYDVYYDNGCYGCHLDYDSGAPSMYGLRMEVEERLPDLAAEDDYFAEMSIEDYLYDAIVNPDSYVPRGYPRGIHPEYFGDKLTPEQVIVMVDYIMSLGDSQWGH